MLVVGLKHFCTKQFLAAHLGGGPGSQGGAQQGTGGRGEQYLDGPARSHTLVAPNCFVVVASTFLGSIPFNSQFYLFWKARSISPG